MNSFVLFLPQTISQVCLAQPRAIGRLIAVLCALCSATALAFTPPPECIENGGAMDCAAPVPGSGWRAYLNSVSGVLLGAPPTLQEAIEILKQAAVARLSSLSGICQVGAPSVTINQVYNASKYAGPSRAIGERRWNREIV